MEIVMFEDLKLEDFSRGDGGESSSERGLEIAMVFHSPPCGDPVPENY
jgi:hypothetical protein